MAKTLEQRERDIWIIYFWGYWDEGYDYYEAVELASKATAEVMARWRTSD